MKKAIVKALRLIRSPSSAHIKARARREMRNLARHGLTRNWLFQANRFNPY